MWITEDKNDSKLLYLITFTLQDEKEDTSKKKNTWKRRDNHKSSGENHKNQAA